MYGLAAIQQANGWAMAGAGACIVLSGLAMLSCFISKLPRLTRQLETRPKPEKPAPIEEPPQTQRIPERMPENPDAATALFAALTRDMGAEFSLVDLHKKAKKMNVPHPHLSINRFRDANILVPKGNGRFSWARDPE